MFGLILTFAFRKKEMPLITSLPLELRKMIWNSNMLQLKYAFGVLNRFENLFKQPKIRVFVPKTCWGQSIHDFKWSLEACLTIASHPYEAPKTTEELLCKSISTIQSQNMWVKSKHLLLSSSQSRLFCNWITAAKVVAKN